MVEYRKATIHDMNDLLKVRMDFLRDVGSVNTEDEETLLLEANEAFLAKTLADGSYVQWLAVDDGKIVATGSVSFYLLPPNKKLPNGKAAYIANMFTYPEYRNQGIASKLLALVVEEAKKFGCKKVLLNATEMGKAIYLKFGFKDSQGDMVYLYD